MVPPPEIVGNHHGVIGVGFVREEEASDFRAGSEGREDARRDDRDLHPFRRHVAHQIHDVLAVQADVLEETAALAIMQVRAVGLTSIPDVQPGRRRR